MGVLLVGVLLVKLVVWGRDQEVLVAHPGAEHG